MIATLRSVAWLFRYELKLQRRSFGRRRTTGLVIGGMLGFWQLFALFLAFVVGRADLPPLPVPLPFAVVTAGLIFLFLGMVSTALDSTVQAIYARGDMDLLLSSPFPRNAIILVRLTAIAVTVCVGGALLALPVANAFILFGDRQWLVAYVTIPCLGLLATTLGLILAISLFRLLGARSTRLVAQVLSATLGITFGLAAQIPNLLQASGMTDLAGLQHIAATLPPPENWVWWPARGAIGERWALLALVAFSLIAFVTTAVALADRFIKSAIAASWVGSGGLRKEPAERPFLTDPIANLRRKEIRLLIRDPWLLTQIARQLVFLMPLTLLVWRAEAGGSSGRWLVLVMTAGYMAGGLTWLTVCGEDARDLLASAPVPPGEILRAKIQAALLPVALFMALPLFVAGWFSPWLGFCLTLCSLGSALCCATLNYLYRKPAQRNQFSRRGLDNMLRSTGEMMIGATWSIAAFLMLKQSLWALLPAAIALLPLHRVLRRAGVRARPTLP